MINCRHPDPAPALLNHALVLQLTLLVLLVLQPTLPNHALVLQLTQQAMH